MRRNLTRTPAMTLALAALASLAPILAPPAGGAEGEQRSFTLSTDPEEVVLQARFSGGMRPSVVYTLYGDGRLVHEEVNEAAKSVRDRVDTQLEFAEREELIRIVVDAGLLECDPECIEKRCAQLLGVQTIPPGRDCRGVMLTLNLETYQAPGESSARSVQRRMYLECPHALVSFYCSERDLPEVQALLELARALNERKRAAQGVEP